MRSADDPVIHRNLWVRTIRPLAESNLPARVGTVLRTFGNEVWEPPLGQTSGGLPFLGFASLLMRSDLLPRRFNLSRSVSHSLVAGVHDLACIGGIEGFASSEHLRSDLLCTEPRGDASEVVIFVRLGELAYLIV